MFPPADKILLLNKAWKESSEESKALEECDVEGKQVKANAFSKGNWVVSQRAAGLCYSDVMVRCATLTTLVENSSPQGRNYEHQIQDFDLLSDHRQVSDGEVG